MDLSRLQSTWNCLLTSQHETKWAHTETEAQSFIRMFVKNVELKINITQLVVFTATVCGSVMKRGHSHITEVQFKVIMQLTITFRVSGVSMANAQTGWDVEGGSSLIKAPSAGQTTLLTQRHEGERTAGGNKKPFSDDCVTCKSEEGSIIIIVVDTSQPPRCADHHRHSDWILIKPSQFCRSL